MRILKPSELSVTEIQILKSLRNENIKKGILYSSGELDILTSLDEVKLTKEQKRKVIYEITQALSCMHSNGYLHTDICAENILYNTKTQTVVLSDFGLSIKCKNVERGILYKEPKKRSHLAPELRLCKDDCRYTSGSDVYALGITILYLFGCLESLASDDFWEIVYSTHDGLSDFIKINVNLNKISKDMGDLLKGMLEYYPKERIKLKDALKSPIFRDIKKNEACKLLSSLIFIVPEVSVKKEDIIEIKRFFLANKFLPVKCFFLSIECYLKLSIANCSDLIETSISIALNYYKLEDVFSHSPFFSVLEKIGPLTNDYYYACETIEELKFIFQIVSKNSFALYLVTKPNDILNYYRVTETKGKPLTDETTLEDYLNCNTPKLSLEIKNNYKDMAISNIISILKQKIAKYDMKTIEKVYPYMGDIKKNIITYLHPEITAKMGNGFHILNDTLIFISDTEIIHFHDFYNQTLNDYANKVNKFYLNYEIEYENSNDYIVRCLILYNMYLIKKEFNKEMFVNNNKVLRGLKLYSALLTHS